MVSEAVAIVIVVPFFVSPVVRAGLDSRALHAWNVAVCGLAFSQHVTGGMAVSILIGSCVLC